MSRRARPALLFGLALVLGGALSANAGDRTERVSVGSGGRQGNGNSDLPALSADGRFVAFESVATNLSPRATDGQPHIFVRDRQYGRTEHVAVGRTPAISAGGRFVAFPSHASDLVSGDTNGTTDVFVRDRGLGLTERVSVGPRGTQGNGRSANNEQNTAISADGRFVVFISEATNLVVDDTNGIGDIFIHDRKLRETERVNLGPGAAQANNESFLPAMSADGRFIAFGSFPPTLCQTIPIA